MRLTFVIVVLSSILFSCSNNPKITRFPDGADKKTVIKVAAAVEVYLGKQLKDAIRSIEGDGDIVFTGGKQSYMYSSDRMLLGEIDDDSSVDAIVPIALFEGESILSIEFLVLLKKGKDYIVIKSLEKIIRALEIKDRIITVEYTEVPPESPYYGCEECTEVVKFKYLNGDIVPVK